MNVGDPGYDEYIDNFGKAIKTMLTQQEYKRLKTRLTRALNAFNDKARWTGDRYTMAHKVYFEATNALEYFEDHGYPDDWHRWERAKEDAQYWMAYEEAR